MAVETNAFRLTDEGTYVPESGQPSSSWLSDNVFRWLDIACSTREELSQILAPLRLHPLVLSYCADTEGVVAVESIDGALVMRVPRPPNLALGDDRDVAVIFVSETLITVHRHHADALQVLIDRLSSRRATPARNPFEPLYHMLDLLSSRLFEEYAQLRARVDALSRGDDGGSVNEVIGRIAELRISVSRLVNVGEDFGAIARGLLTMRSEEFDLGDMRVYVRESANSSDQLQRWVIRLDGRLDDLERSYELRLQGVTNNRLKLLTILSAVFMPLTLITGIFGMNFEVMPELSYRNGYYHTLAIMGAIGSIMLIWFWRKGWFK